MDSLKRAVKDAKLKLTLNSEIEPALIISNYNNSSIIIQEEVIGNVLYFVVHIGTNIEKPIIKLPKNKYRYIYLENLIDCRIFVKCKLLKIMFRNCKTCNISIRAPIISAAEFYKCNSTIITIRISSYQQLQIPTIVLEDCTKLKLFQSIESQIYIMRICIDVIGILIDENTGKRIQEYSLGKMFWNSGETVYYGLSKTEGFIKEDSEFTLNEIGHTFFINNPDVLDDDNDVFGTTPPVNNFWDKYLNTKL